MDKNIINIHDRKILTELFEAIDFAAFKHRYQKRKGIKPVPYINHPISVTKHLIDNLENPSLELLQAAILHDTLEDTKTTSEEIDQKFGSKVTSIVFELTDNMTLPYHVRKKLQIENASRISYEGGCIKIADKYCNIYDILNTKLGWTRKRKIRYIVWAAEVVEQIPLRDTKLEQSFIKIVNEAKVLLKTDF
jgi:(p)ppGpp synthase/HD superfamily hydrolase